jgi:GMP synthase (glutamine-hydrolysing)
MTVAVLQHDVDAPAGLLGEWLDARGQAWEVWNPAQRLPPLEPLTAIVALGSAASVARRDAPWIESEVAYLRDVLAAGAPLLGVCFGAQLLADATGGSVVRAGTPEVGWVEPATDETPLAGPWFTWHVDEVKPPPVADVLARSPHGVQAFRLGPHLGVQFHPEVTPPIARRWAENEPGEARLSGNEPSELLAQLRVRERDLRPRAHALFDWWWRGAALA